MIELIKNVHDVKYGQEGEVYFSLFNKYISLHNWQGASQAYVLKCAEYLNSFDAVIINSLCKASIHYCNDVLETIGEDLKQFDNPQDILSLIYPNSLNIPDPKGHEEPVVHMELNCEWEEEHGMEWIIRNDRVLYVGAYNGENPWGEFEAEDFCNYV